MVRSFQLPSPRFVSNQGQWADSRPSPTERWREVCRGVVAIGAKIVRGHAEALESAVCGRMSGRRLVLRSHACCRSSRNNAEGQAAMVHQSRCVGCRFVSRCPRWDRQSSDFWGTSLLISRLSTQAGRLDRLKSEDARRGCISPCRRAS